MMSITLLESWLHKSLPGSRLVRQVLPRAKPLELVLLDPKFDDTNLSQAVQNELMDDPPYWIFCWASGYALAEELLSGGLDVKDKTVIDFGCGSGAGAIAAKLAGAKRVYACDIDPVGLAVCELNAKINGVELEFISDVSKASGVDLLIAADVLYEKANYHFLDLFLDTAPESIVADSRLKAMPNKGFELVKTVVTTSFPDFDEAKEFNSVNFYRGVNR